jgi:hypothetical protein
MLCLKKLSESEKIINLECKLGLGNPYPWRDVKTGTVRGRGPKLGAKYPRHSGALSEHVTCELHPKCKLHFDNLINLT